MSETEPGYHHIELEPGDVDPINVAPTRVQALALSGGGARGVFSAHLLVQLETMAAEPLRKRFSLIAGTSVGALLASGLALGLSAATLYKAIQTHVPTIFRTRFINAINPFRLRRAPYDLADLRKAIRLVLEDKADTLLSDLTSPLLIVAVDATERKPYIFRSRAIAGAQASKVKIIDAISASAAAPTFFNAIKFDGRVLVDGGIIANAPEMAALVDLHGIRNADLSEIHILGVGTATPHPPGLTKIGGNVGAVEWIAQRKLVELIMDAQTGLTESYCKQVLGDRYLKLDQAPLAKELELVASMDNASPEAISTLINMAKRRWTTAQHDPILQAFFPRR